MEQNNDYIDYKKAYHEQLAINEKLELKHQDLAFQLAQLQKLVFGSRHEKFISADAQMAPTLFDIPAIPELLEPITVSYDKPAKQSRPNHPGRNSFP